MHNLAEAYQESGKLDQAQPLYEETLKLKNATLGPKHPQVAGSLAALGLNLLRQQKHFEAEAILRECLAIREEKEPEDWRTFNTRSTLGEALSGQEKYPEAEPLLLSGYEGMNEREAKIPPQRKIRLTEALERLVNLYEAWNKPDQVAQWREKLDAAPPKAQTTTNAVAPKRETQGAAAPARANGK